MSDMTMVERVARAIKTAMHREDDADPDAPLRYARVAIEAMREPGSGIVKAGAEGCGEDTVTALSAWQAMIDAALSETQP